MIKYNHSVSYVMDLMSAARGELPADLVIKNGNLINVDTSEVYKADIAIKDSFIIAVGNVDYCLGKETRIIDASNKYITPGFIESHIHVAGSHLSMPELAKVLIAHGTTTISTDFSHIGIVGGIDSIKFFLNTIKNTPLKTLFVLPTMSYFQNRQLGFPPTPAAPKIEDMRKMLDWPECIGIGETTYDALKDDVDLIELFNFAKSKNKVITGTGTGAKGNNLNAYLLTGSASDHEMKSAQETVDKARLGMYMHIREGSATSDLNETIKALTEYKINPRHFIFCTDEEEPSRLNDIGNIDNKMQLAVKKGLDSVTAIQMATINAAEFFRISDFLGSISPGKIADIVLINSLDEFRVSSVIIDGKLVFNEGKHLWQSNPIKYPSYMTESIKLPRDIQIEDIQIKTTEKESGSVNVIQIEEGNLLTKRFITRMQVKKGYIESDVKQDILKIVYIDRHTGSGKIGLGLINGFGLKKGAIAESFTALSENLIVVGVDDESICFAVNKLKEVGGGLIAVDGRQILGLVELPILGLISKCQLDEVVLSKKNLLNAIHKLGCELRSPFTTLGFMGIMPLGRIKMCDQGLFDVELKKLIPLIESEEND